MKHIFINVFLKNKTKSAILIIVLIAFWQRGATLFVELYDIDELYEIIASRQLIDNPNDPIILERPLSFVFLVLKLFQNFSQYDVLILHVATIFWILFNAWLLFKINLVLFQQYAAGYFAALLYVMFVSSFFDKYLAVHGEIIFNPVVCAALFCFIKANFNQSQKFKIKLYLILAGAISACALLIKGQTIAGLGTMFLYSLLSQRLKQTVWIGLGLGGGLLALFVLYYFLDMSLHLKNYVFSNFFYLVYGFSDLAQNQGTWLSTLDSILSNNLIPSILAQFPLWLLLIRFLKYNPWQNPQIPILILFFACSSFAILMGGLRFYNHYFIQYLPALCLIAGKAFQEYLQSYKISKIRIAYTLLVLTMLVSPLWNYTNAYFVHHKPQKIQSQSHILTPQKSYAQIAHWLKNNTKPSQSIAVWGPFIEIYWFSQRKPAFRVLWSERYMFAYNIYQNKNPQRPKAHFNPQTFQNILQLPPYQQWDWGSAQKILYSIILDIHNKQPVWIIDSTYNTSRHFPNSLTQLPIVSEYLLKHYIFKKTINSMKIYAQKKP